MILSNNIKGKLRVATHHGMHMMTSASVVPAGTPSAAKTPGYLRLSWRLSILRHHALYTENGIAIQLHLELVEAVQVETMTVNYHPGGDKKIHNS
jgi:hypothetical protein